MNYYPQSGTGEQLCRIAEDYEDRAAERESEVSAEKLEIIRSTQSIIDAFDTQESGDDIQTIYLALAKMFQEYKTNDQSYDDRAKGILDVFYHDIAPIYERCIEKEAAYRAANMERRQ